MTRTCDLRVFAQLAVARLQREGVAGYAETLTSIRQVLETRWALVHPQLDPEDDNDPTLRGNALLAIAEPVRVIRFLRYMPLARSARAGTVSWRDISIANGVVEVDDGTTKLTEAVISAAFRESDPGVLATLRESLVSCAASAVAIPAVFDAEAGYGTGPELADLIKLLRDMQRMIDTYHVASGENAIDASVEAVANDQDNPSLAMDGPRLRGAVNITSLGSIKTRADAVRLMDLVIEYYERNEPSSPLPLLIARARRLADKGFMDLLRDLAPDGVGQAERIAGPSET